MARDFIELNGVKIIWPNFSGIPSQYNSKGNRTFNVVLNEQVAHDLEMRGLNVKRHESKDPDGEPIWTLQCFVSFTPYPPDELYRIIPRGKMRMNEDTIGNLDHEDIEKANVKLNLSHWKMQGREGIKPYVNKMAVWVNEDSFADSYRDIPEIGNGPAFGGDEEEALPF